MTRRRRFDVVLPFLSHQVLEYLGALYLLQVGSHLKGRPAAVCYVAGVVMLVSATFSGRPLGGGPLPRHLHRLVDVVLVLGVAAAPFLFHFTDQVTATLRLEGLAVVFAFLVKVTNYAHPQPRRRRRPPSRQSAPFPPRRPEETLKVTARKAGRATGIVKQKGPRAAGQFVGRQLKRRRPGG
ncbi:MAG TPA: hypothetical protein VGR20_10540 [Acidimicrobiia bacterium]|nr:hypothetical protein [Acidimicrobiia bacterium]